MNQLQAMRVFINIAETMSFGQAAAHLGISNAMATRYLDQLETHLNTRLVNRNTRGLSLTEEGEIYLKGCRNVLDEIEQIETVVLRATTEPSGTLRVAAGASFSLSSLTPLLQEYLREYPNVRLSLTLLHQHVDFVKEGFDVGIVLPKQISGTTLVKRSLLSVRPIAVASPGYLAGKGIPSRPADLAAHTLLALSSASHDGDWVFVSPDQRERRVTLSAALVVNNASMLRQATLAGMGIAVLPENHVLADLGNGALVQIMPDFHITNADKELALVYANRRHISAKTRSFVDFSIEWFRTNADRLTSMASVGKYPAQSPRDSRAPGKQPS
ncbi:MULTISPECIES: LysR family transcriptional regulator [unclassified Paraburkholderia]|uniref:LysR family transcriptional regulator n=1 Tax=unclassified Paraburkholderia TaxID=2615204 RepID=UPI000E28386C|nr:MULTISPECIES: LysR family transcriptional regulator [unclassified Paraburkholderia]REE21918.1 LysR family transcriptional regulator [Paraburkholderia sp. BL27I4N3]RKR39049.1 LysR family transcriptional regulator [Paraburkholderia sp. BL17N1]